MASIFAVYICRLRTSQRHSLDGRAKNHPPETRQRENRRASAVFIKTPCNHCYGPDMGAYLCFMAVRLTEMHRVLKPTGSIYLHCDYTTQPYLRSMLDGLLGNGENDKEGFRTDIIWQMKSVSALAAQRCMGQGPAGPVELAGRRPDAAGAGMVRLELSRPLAVALPGQQLCQPGHRM